MAEATKGLGLVSLFIQLPQPNERIYQTRACDTCQKNRNRFLEKRKSWGSVNSEKGALSKCISGDINGLRKEDSGARELILL
jgi:hypothetical protein